MPYNYFQRFPTVTFDSTVMTDITRRIALYALGKQSIVGFEKYNIKDGETPESVAFKFYGDTGYHWLIIIANEVINPFYDWPLTDTELKAVVQKKYGIGHENDIHHWEPSQYSTLPKGTYLDETSVVLAERQPVTNYEHEANQNEKKRAIRIIRKEFVAGLIEEFQSKIIA